MGFDPIEMAQAGELRRINELIQDIIPADAIAQSSQFIIVSPLIRFSTEESAVQYGDVFFVAGVAAFKLLAVDKKRGQAGSGLIAT